MAEPDFYNVLGVTPASEQAVIDAAYRALMLKYHPDKSAGGPSDLRRAREINQAYEALRDPRRRAEYNLQRSRTTNLPVTYSARNEESEELPSPQAATKNCIECDEPIRLNARVCRYCSAQQFGPSASQSHATNVHTHIYPSAPPSTASVDTPKSGLSCLAIFGWTLLGLLAILMGIGIIGSSSGFIKLSPSDKVPGANVSSENDSLNEPKTAIEQPPSFRTGDARLDKSTELARMQATIKPEDMNPEAACQLLHQKCDQVQASRNAASQNIQQLADDLEKEGFNVTTADPIEN